MTDPSFWPQEPGTYAGTGAQYVAAHDEARRIASRLGVAAPSGVLVTAADLDAARVAFHAEYATLVEDTRARMTDVAARTALARLEARGQNPPDDPGAEQAADVADERGRAETEDAAEEARRRSAELAAGHGAAVGSMAPMAGMAGMGGFGRSLSAEGTHRAAHYAIPAGAPADLDLRLRELCGAVDGPARGWVRMAVAEVADEAGRPWRLIGTTELDGYLRPGVVLRDGELAAGNETWPELSIATFCAAHGFTPGPVVGAVEPPPDVCEYLREAGFAPSWSADAWNTHWGDTDAPLE
ncbi:hypothetical protein AXK57_13550 [Tsukamurella pulmonis]|uniref:Uncharacterized protein n=3 Tax=Tsukamurella pulmonis TaxID=47312 RepID=A0A1H1DUM2_9ACTN|nr:hypothetical protein [Tsukamurella pulmonis]KXO92203.1 hypothetical protein AXK56_03715 [Tsukamurella pulmonis]KXP09851.1 hypothetical protein AXK57_13550 [Tsukamurella pulmonis]SDQ79959.1 hypothetical protein SAMN04489765_1889 [Tsukamurella pulmonis]SUP21678.1 Uncharacterised protein [Tsukamurella pulmonis]